MIILSLTPLDVILSFPQEALFCLGFLFFIVLSVAPRFSRDHAFGTLLPLSLACAALSAVALPTYQNLLISNTATSSCKALVCVFFSLILVLDYYCTRSGKVTLTLLGFSLLAMLFVLSSNDWFFLFLALELLTLSSYCLVALPRTRRSLEGALKYFAAGSISTCFILFGILMLFISTESTAFDVFPTHSYYAALSFTVFTSSAMLIKVGAAPFHYWVIDAYEGAPAIVTVFLAVVVKLCIFFVLSRLLFGPLFDAISLWRPAFIACSGFSIILGCFGAIFQKRVKRLLAYSSINNAGYALAGLAVGNVGGLQASLCYMLFYCLALTLLFSILLGPKGCRPITYVSELKRLRDPLLPGVITAITLFSMAGVPPLTGFWIKFFVLSELVSCKLYVLAALGVFASVVSSFYYVSLIKVLHFETPASPTERMPIGLPTPFVLIMASSLVAYPLFPGIVFNRSGSLALSFLTEFL